MSSVRDLVNVSARPGRPAKAKAVKSSAYKSDENAVNQATPALSPIESRQKQRELARLLLDLKKFTSDSIEDALAEIVVPDGHEQTLNLLRQLKSKAKTTRKPRRSTGGSASKVLSDEGVRFIHTLERMTEFVKIVEANAEKLRVNLNELDFETVLDMDACKKKIQEASDDVNITQVALVLKQVQLGYYFSVLFTHWESLPSALRPTWADLVTSITPFYSVGGPVGAWKYRHLFAIFQQFPRLILSGLSMTAILDNFGTFLSVVNHGDRELNNHWKFFTTASKPLISITFGLKGKVMKMRIPPVLTPSQIEACQLKFLEQSKIVDGEVEAAESIRAKQSKEAVESLTPVLNSENAVARIVSDDDDEDYIDEDHDDDHYDYDDQYDNQHGAGEYTDAELLRVTSNDHMDIETSE
jgi:hypothetical protein